MKLLAWKESISKDWTLLQRRVSDGEVTSEAIARLQHEQRSLKSASDDLKAQVASASAALHSVEQRLLARAQDQTHELRSQLRGDIERLVSEGSKRTVKDSKLVKRQLDSVDEKLDELDQIVKLVGKQLIQNTSQLQRLRDDRRQIRMAALLAPESLLLDDTSGEPEEARRDKTETETATKTQQQQQETDDELPDDTALRELRSQHATLRDAIQDKLRHYQEILQQED